MMQKTCTKCLETKSLDDFNWTMGKTRKMYWCKTCESIKKKEYRQKNLSKVRQQTRERNRLKTFRYQQLYNETVKVKVIDYLRTHPCVDCGETDIIVLEFDHLVPAEKTASIARLMARRYPWEVISAEIAKCVVRCANCHRRKTAKERGWLKLNVQPSSENME